MLNLCLPTPITKIESNFLYKKQVEIFIKRDDLIHSVISGNKWRKLKYNLQLAKHKKYSTVLSFGGPYSNHLHALSYVSNKMGFKSIGVVRGHNNNHLSHTLKFCKQNNMLLYNLDRKNYRLHKSSNLLLQSLENRFGKFYVIPEGGNNQLGAKGCSEILNEVNLEFNYLCCPVGTGCTASGLISSMFQNQSFIGFCPFKKCIEQKNSINNFVNPLLNKNWILLPDNHFGGFAKINHNLIKFVQQFNSDFDIKLDLIYMGKLFYSIFDLIENNYFPKNSKILVLHTGGIQGVNGFNFKY